MPVSMSGHIWKQNRNSVLSRDLKDVEVLPRMYCCLIIKWTEIPWNILQLSFIECKAEIDEFIAFVKADSNVIDVF